MLTLFLEKLKFPHFRCHRFSPKNILKSGNLKLNKSSGRPHRLHGSRKAGSHSGTTAAAVDEKDAFRFGDQDMTLYDKI